MWGALSRYTFKIRRCGPWKHSKLGGTHKSLPPVHRQKMAITLQLWVSMLSQSSCLWWQETTESQPLSPHGNTRWIWKNCPGADNQNLISEHDQPFPECTCTYAKLLKFQWRAEAPTLPQECTMIHTSLWREKSPRCVTLAGLQSASGLAGWVYTRLSHHSHS